MIVCACLHTHLRICVFPHTCVFPRIAVCSIFFSIRELLGVSCRVECSGARRHRMGISAVLRGSAPQTENQQELWEQTVSMPL